MSFDLDTYVPAIPSDLVVRWKTRLRGFGLRCEFHPDFDPRRWKGYYLPVKVLLDESKHSNLAKQGCGPWIGGFEFEIDDFDPSKEDMSWAGELITTKLLKMRHRVFFATRMGRTRLDSMLQYYSAATLASIARGILHDPQLGKCFVGKAAVDQAKQMFKRFRNSGDEFAVWRLPPFPGWNLSEFDDSDSERIPGANSSAIGAAEPLPLASELQNKKLKNVSSVDGFRYFSGNLCEVSNHPAIYAHGEGVTVVGRDFHKTYHPYDVDDAIKDYFAILRKRGYPAVRSTK